MFFQEKKSWNLLLPSQSLSSFPYALAACEHRKKQVLISAVTLIPLEALGKSCILWPLQQLW